MIQLKGFFSFFFKLNARKKNQEEIINKKVLELALRMQFVIY